MKKIVGIILICILIICMGSSICFANLVDPLEDPDEYIPSTSTGNEKFVSMANIVLGVIRVIGSGVAVLTLVILGIRYMMGSASQKAEYKETMIPYLIGAIMLFTIPNLLSIIYGLIKNNIAI